MRTILESHSWESFGAIGLWCIYAALFCVQASPAAVYTPSAFRINGTTAQSPSACQTAGACDGWVLEIDIPTIAAAGTYNYGLGTNNAISAAKIIVKVTHNGYQNGLNGGTCGTATTYTQTLYGTNVLRQPYPNPTVNDDQVNGGTLTMRIALGSDTGPAMIFAGETVTVQIVSSFYTAGGNTVGTVGAGTAVTNNSTLSYAKARTIFNWSYPGWNRVTGTFNVRGVGFSQFARNSLPIACVVFTVTDANNHSNTTTVNVPTIDNSLGDVSKIVEYVGAMSVSGLTNHDKLTLNFKAYPWVGDSTAVMDSSDGTYAQPTPLYAPQYGQLDTTNNYSAAAYVDSTLNVPGSVTSGTFQAGEIVTQLTSNAKAYVIAVPGGAGPLKIGAIYSGTVSGVTGRTWTGGTSAAVFTQTVYTVTSNTNTTISAGLDANSCAAAESGGQPITACATINGAAVKMETFNAATSTPTHADACGTMYLNQGYYNWTGASGTVSDTTANCWANIVPAAGVTKAQVVIDGQSGSQSFGARCTANLTSCSTPVHLSGLTINYATGSANFMTGMSYLWLDSDTIIYAGSGVPFYQDTMVYFTDSSIPSTLGGNYLVPFSGVSSAYSLFRGNDLTTACAGVGVMIYTAIGNSNTASGDCTFRTEPSGTFLAANLMPVIAFNSMFYQNNLSNSLFATLYTTSNSIGQAVVQNIGEQINSDDSLVMFALTADGSTGTPINNAMIWNNTLVGGRLNRSYNDSGAVALLRQSWSEVGNIFNTEAIKSDTFGTANAARVGNWMELYGAGVRSGVSVQATGFAATGAFCQQFPGINLDQGALGAGNPPACTTRAYTYPSYKTWNATTGPGNTGAGGGDYRLLSNSPAINLIPVATQVLPYDLAGQIRNNSGWGSAGAYEQAIIQTQAFGW